MKDLSPAKLVCPGYLENGGPCFKPWLRQAVARGGVLRVEVCPIFWRLTPFDIRDLFLAYRNSGGLLTMGWIPEEELGQDGRT